MLLSTAYFPPVEYFSILAKYSVVYVDDLENYQKQSYRNRCRILTASGPEDLRFPIIHDGARSIKDIRVDYKTPWVRQTEYAIETAYSSSPFFEYYRDPLYGILDSNPEYLWDLNASLTAFFAEKIGLATDIRLLSSLSGPLPEGEDLRSAIHPKRPPIMVNSPYWQVFREKHGFVPNLSVMDLLFNEGPESVCYLK